MDKKFLVVLTGPTGIGKTSVGIAIAKYFNTEIVSSDSRQIFKELSIGTAVPKKCELQQAKHHFIHSHSLIEDYNASKYEHEALKKIVELFIEKNTLVMVGGSMLYIDAVCNGIDEIPDADPEIRNNLNQQLKSDGIESLRIQLKKLDPAYYREVDLKNPARIIHALEICLTTGKTYSSFRKNTKKKRPFTSIKIGLNCDRETLHQRINKRVDEMIEDGLEQEARRVYPLRHLRSLNTVGYKEWFTYFDGEIPKEKAIELIKRNSRRYARKQLTWFRRDKEIKWFEPKQTEEIIHFIKKIMNHENE